MNGIEYELSAYGIRVIWNAPNYSWGDLFEYCWSQSKGYADTMYFMGRTMVELAEHIHEGLNTGKVARPGMSYIKGGNFVLDADSGECDSARKIFEHGFHSLDTHNPGLQTIIDADDELSGEFPDIKCSVEVWRRAVKPHLRGCLRWMVRDVLALDEPVESDNDGSDNDEDDASDDAEPI